MYTFVMQVRDLFLNTRFHYYITFFLFVWFFWTVKAVIASRYRSVDAPYQVTTSVVVPVVDEDPADFRKVLALIKEAGPTETIVVINGQHNPALERVCEELGVAFIWTRTPGKRHAIKLGLEKTRGEIVILVDSDTRWDPNTLSELVKPFADPTVGGVTTSQRIYGRERHILTRFADWMEDIRTRYSMPAMSVFGSVGCLPGRTIGFRRSIIENNLEKFLGEKFLGIFLEVSDDRTLTNYVLQDGYKTVLQRTSRVWTDAPTSYRKYARQQLRWARGSQYNTLRMLGFMVRKTPYLCFSYVVDVLIPFFWLGTIINLVWKVAVGDPTPYMVGTVWEQVLLVVFGILVSVAIRNLSHLRSHPEDWPYLPAFILLQSLLLTPIRIYGFFKMARDSGWGTRANAHQGTSQVHALVVCRM